jgi:hypothetical protein
MSCAPQLSAIEKRIMRAKTVLATSKRLCDVAAAAEFSAGGFK